MSAAPFFLLVRRVGDELERSAEPSREQLDAVPEIMAATVTCRQMEVRVFGGVVRSEKKGRGDIVAYLPAGGSMDKASRRKARGCAPLMGRRVRLVHPWLTS